MRRDGRAGRWCAMAAALAIVSGVVAVGAPPAGADETWWWPVEPVPGAENVAATADGRVLTLTDDPGIKVWLQALDGTWSGPTLLSHGSGEAIPLVRGDETYVAWASPLDRYNLLVGASRLVGDAWVAVPSTTVPMGDTLGRWYDVAAALHPDGTIDVAWVDPNAGYSVSLTSFDGSAWSAPQAVPATLRANVIDLEVTDAGERVLAVRMGGVDDLVPSMWTITDPGTGWGAPHRVIGPDEGVGAPQIHVTRGGATVLFPHLIAGWGTVPRSTRLIDGAWSAPTTVHPFKFGAWSAAVRPDGELTFILGQSDWRDPYLTITEYTSVGSGWTGPSPVVHLDDIGWSSGARLHLAVGTDGTSAVVLAVDPPGSGPDHLMTIARRPGRTWTPPGFWELPPTMPRDIPGTPTAAVDSYGYAHFGWSEGNVSRYLLTMVVPFSDLVPGAFYVGPVLWASDVGLTTGVGGTDQFQPDRSITRAEALTTLWRLAGSPGGSPPSGFSDVRAGTFYSAAVDWGRANGLTTGVGGTNAFQPDRTITRGELLTLMWRLAGSPPAPPSGFEDDAVGAFYGPAVGWARQVGLTTGVGGTNRVEPNRAITRAETFTLVYRLVLSSAVFPSSDVDGTERPMPGADVRPDIGR